MADLHEAYEDRRAALIAASNLLKVAPEDLVGGAQASVGAFVALADLVHAGYFPGSPLIAGNESS